MPLKREETTNYEELEEALLTARKTQEQVIEKFEHRLKSVEDAEDEIISSYSNSPELNLGNNPSLLDCIQVQSFGQALLNRLTAIELEAIRTKSNLVNKRRPLQNAILGALGSSGSSETRRAKAEGATEVLNALIEREDGLLAICETVRKNILRAQDTASRSQTAIQHEIQYLNGTDVHSELVQSTRQKLR